MGGLIGFPNQIEVTLGTGWTGARAVELSMAEDDVLVLTIVAGSNDTNAFYSEDGSNIASVNNRIYLQFHSEITNPGGSQYQYRNIVLKGYTLYLGTSPNFYTDVLIYGYVYGTSPVVYPYTFKDVWDANSVFSNYASNFIPGGGNYQSYIFKTFDEYGGGSFETYVNTDMWTTGQSSSSSSSSSRSSSSSSSSSRSSSSSSSSRSSSSSSSISLSSSSSTSYGCPGDCSGCEDTLYVRISGLSGSCDQGSQDCSLFNGLWTFSRTECAWTGSHPVENESMAISCINGFPNPGSQWAAFISCSGFDAVWIISCDECGDSSCPPEGTWNWSEAFGPTCSSGTMVLSYISSSSSSSLSSSSSSSSSCSKDFTDKVYSKGDYASLPTDDSNLETEFSCPEYPVVYADDDQYVRQAATDEFAVKQFKNKFDVDSMAIVVEWKGKMGLTTSGSTAYLQIYNYDSPGWETLDTDTTTVSGTEFILSGTQSEDVTNYYDGSNWVTCRIYQEAV